MNNPGTYVLCATEIKTAITAEAFTPIVDLSGASAVSLTARLAYGSGGSGVAGKVQTSLDGGTTWLDVAFFSFSTASATKRANLSGMTPVAVAAYADLSADGVNDGLIGDRLRAVVTSTGTYAGSTVLSIIASVR